MNTTLKKILPLAMAAFLAGGCAAKNAPDPSPAPTGTPTPLPTVMKTYTANSAPVWKSCNRIPKALKRGEPSRLSSCVFCIQHFAPSMLKRTRRSVTARRCAVSPFSPRFALGFPALAPDALQPAR